MPKLRNLAVLPLILLVFALASPVLAEQTEAKPFSFDQLEALPAIAGVDAMLEELSTLDLRSAEAKSDFCGIICILEIRITEYKLIIERLKITWIFLSDAEKVELACKILELAEEIKQLSKEIKILTAEIYGEGSEEHKLACEILKTACKILELAQKLKEAALEPDLAILIIEYLYIEICIIEVEVKEIKIIICERPDIKPSDIVVTL